MKVVYCAHRNSPKKNIGDVLSAYALAIMFGEKFNDLFVLPDDIGFSSDSEVKFPRRIGRKIESNKNLVFYFVFVEN